MNYSIRLYTLSFILCFLSGFTNVNAQYIPSENSVTPSSLDLFHSTNLWFETQNAAGLSSSKQMQYTNVYGGYSYTKGDFRRQQEGKKNTGFLFNAEGLIPLYGGYLWGKFSFENESKEDSRFNASIIDPFRGNPFIIADDRSSEWKLQYYNLSAKASSRKIFNQIFAGIGFNYKVSTGAKQLDPRPLNTFYQLTVTPSLVWALDNKNNIGATFYFKNQRETSSISLEYSDYAQIIYKLYGVGAFEETTTRSARREYKGNTTGFEIQYGHNVNNRNFIFNAGYQEAYEDVIDGSSQLLNTGKTLTDIYHASSALVINNQESVHKINLDLSLSSTDGLFYDKKVDPNDASEYVISYKKKRYSMKNQMYKMNYDLFLTNKNGYDWNVGTTLTYLSYKEEYLLPQQGVGKSKQDIGRYNLNLHGKYNLKTKFLPWKGSILIGADVTYSKASDCNLFYGGLKPDHKIVKELLVADYSVLSANYWKIGADLQHSFPLSISNKKIEAYAKASGYFIPQIENKRRGNATISIGFML